MSKENLILSSSLHSTAQHPRPTTIREQNEKAASEKRHRNGSDKNVIAAFLTAILSRGEKLGQCVRAATYYLTTTPFKTENTATLLQLSSSLAHVAQKLFVLLVVVFGAVFGVGGIVLVRVPGRPDRICAFGVVLWNKVPSASGAPGSKLTAAVNSTPGRAGSGRLFTKQHRQSFNPGTRAGLFFLFGHKPKHFWNDRKNLTRFGQNVWK